MDTDKDTLKVTDKMENVDDDKQSISSQEDLQNEDKTEPNEDKMLDVEKRQTLQGTKDEDKQSTSSQEQLVKEDKKDEHDVSERVVDNSEKETLNHVTVDIEKETEKETIAMKTLNNNGTEENEEVVGKQEASGNPDITVIAVDVNQNGKERTQNEEKVEGNDSLDGIPVIHGKKKTEASRKDSDEIATETSEDGFIKMKGDEDVDALSTLSFKERKDFKYYFQHPFLRLFIAYFVTFCNFLIYAEDPVAHSLKECNIPLVGNDFAFVFTRYPPNAWSLLKVILWITAIIIGMLVGKFLVHKLLFCRVARLKMFVDDQGSWMIMFLMCLISIFIISWLYNAFLLAGGDSTLDYRISGLMGLTNSIFMKMAATGTWCGDFFTAWMVTDMMLQERWYPYWARPVRKWWNKKFNRIILFWVVTSVTSFVVLFTIATDYIQWDKLNRDFLSSNELSRAFLASFILVMDILIVVQDWDFPHFVSAIDIKLPGINTAHIQFEIPKCCNPEKWKIHITGKWFNYGILFLVMILDLNMWKNQIFYYPYDYGQYVDSDGKIHSVKDEYSLENHNETLLSFWYRNSTINPSTNQTFIMGDSVMNSRYKDFSLGVKAIAFIPAIAAFITFGILVMNFGRFKPSKDDPYAGRLFKRPKAQKKSSFKIFRDSMRRRLSLRNRVKAVPKLLAFTRRRDTEKAGFPENNKPPTDPM